MATNDVLAARSALAHACRSGDADKIRAAHLNLERAKIARLRADADRAEQGIVSRNRAYMQSFGEKEAVSKENHTALQQAQRMAVDAFLREHPRDADEPWSKEIRSEYRAMLDGFIAAHAALGCLEISSCRKGGS